MTLMNIDTTKLYKQTTEIHFLNRKTVAPPGVRDDEIGLIVF